MRYDLLDERWRKWVDYENETREFFPFYADSATALLVLLQAPLFLILLIALSSSIVRKLGRKQSRINGHHSDGNAAVLNNVAASGIRVGMNRMTMLIAMPHSSHLFPNGLKVKIDWWIERAEMT